MGDYEATLDDRVQFLDETNKYYGVDMKVLTKPYREERKKYYLRVQVMTTVLKDFETKLQIQITCLCETEALGSGL
ncbi:hypothetical protein Scep_017318 [Stephania cephalantha]|uniref:Uncharacterized protein n=1 Tax=Stephania cephalantha TaxID=152367 RepID=A0AAP0IPU8_9MAGN